MLSDTKWKTKKHTVVKYLRFTISVKTKKLCVLVFHNIMRNNLHSNASEIVEFSLCIMRIEYNKNMQRTSEIK